MKEAQIVATIHKIGEDIITLSTCDYEKDAERFVVVAKRVK